MWPSRIFAGSLQLNPSTYTVLKLFDPLKVSPEISFENLILCVLAFFREIAKYRKYAIFLVSRSEQSAVEHFGVHMARESSDSNEVGLDTLIFSLNTNFDNFYYKIKILV